MGLTDIIHENHYPILFIGSGISKRYLEGSPTWTDLLEEYWKRLNQSQNFYAYLRNLDNQYHGESDDERDFQANTIAGTEIEKMFNDAFFKGTVTVSGLTLKEAQQKHVSPFKYDLAKRFSKVSLRKDIDMPEFNAFKVLLQKSRIIVTTNYDPLVEQTIAQSSNQKPKIYVGNTGFFDDSSEGWSEIYKIHGSATSPDSIMINQSDYDEYDKNSILVSAKILSSMIDSPILFLGYSLTDRDIRKLLMDFSNQLPREDARKSANRIFVVSYAPGVTNIEEQIVRDNDLNFNYTLIETDNYKSLYTKVCAIDEGVTPYEVRRFQHVIKKIIVSSGQKRALDSYLVSPTDLNKLENRVDDGKPIVVALGDAKNIFVTPTPTEYLSDYILKKFEIQSENALRFIAREQSMGRYPLLHHYQTVNLNQTNLEKFEKDRLTARIKRDESNLSHIKSSINEHNRESYSNIADISSLPNLKKAKMIDLVTYNSDRFTPEALTDYVQHVALPDFIRIYKQRNEKNGAEKSAYRKLFVAWDILNYGQKKPV